MGNKKVTETTKSDSVKPYFQIDPAYKEFLKEIKQKIHAAQLKAALAVNQVLLQFYWEIGSLIIKKQ